MVQHLCKHCDLISYLGHPRRKPGMATCVSETPVHAGRRQEGPSVFLTTGLVPDSMRDLTSRKWEG